jgi:Undecaprenyl-phosphate glucose phosphotransferase
MAQSGNVQSISRRTPSSSYFFMCNALLFPLIAAASVAVSAWMVAREYGSRDFFLSVLAFLLANLILDEPRVTLRSGWKAGLSELTDICIRWLMVLCITLALLKIASLLGYYDRSMLGLWAVLAPLSMWLAQMSLRSMFTAHAGDTGGARRAVIVGVSDVGVRLETRLMSTPTFGTSVLGYFEDRSEDRVPAECRERILGKSRDLAAYAADHGVQVVYIAIPMSRQQRILDLLDSLRDSTVSVYFVPDLFVFDLIQARLDALGGIPLIAVCESPFYGARAIAKRLLDIAVASLLLLLTSPIFLLAAIGVKLSSRGPVLFRQARYGLDGQLISVYKFRSMSVAEDGAGTYKQVTRADPRVTPFGNFLRRTSIDELPQLLNVLQGSMSIVGPRPHVTAVNEHYRRLIPGYMVRHKIRPGITGWAQVNGYRGGDDLESMTKRIECDLEYLRCWSLGLDIRIILRTVMLVINDQRAY